MVSGSVPAGFWLLHARVLRLWFGRKARTKIESVAASPAESWPTGSVFLCTTPLAGWSVGPLSDGTLMTHLP